MRIVFPDNVDEESNNVKDPVPGSMMMFRMQRDDADIDVTDSTNNIDNDR